jgi:antitoxin (DNA-binding transcriptional repressor) of toxin-antitoxin stability system
MGAVARKESVIIESQKGLGPILAEVAAGHDVSVVHNGTVIALVHPPPSPEETGRWRFFGSQKGGIQIADDFDAPLEDFKDYMP